MQNLASVKAQSWLVWFLKGLLLFGFAILIGRLAELQVIKGGYFRSLADGNRIRRVPITAPRGEILARGGETLVGNRESKTWVTFNPENGFEKKPVDESTPADEIITEWQRDYLLGSDFAHVSGYLGQANENEVGKVSPNCTPKGPLKLGDWIGRGGLEQQYGCTLRGVDGEEMVEVDTFGHKIRTIGRRNPQPGQDLKTTIDYDLQRKVASIVNQLDGKIAVIATDGKGEILAFYSYPSFDPARVSDYLIDENLPLFNRVIGGAYHPGSVFKLVTAAAALQEKKIDNDFRYDDPGILTVNGFTYANWYFTQYGGKEGEIGLTRAIARSTDTFFYKVGELLGPDLLAQWAGKFGVGKPTGVDLPGEVAGLVPTPAWKKDYKNENWFLGNTYHMSIGQGDLTTTPLEVNLFTSAVVNDGMLCRPHIEEADPQCQRVPVDDKYFEEIKQGMFEACQSGGTGYPFFDFEPKVLCKTGTAETEDKDKTHAWFTVAAPHDNPEIVLTILVEKGGEGSKVAAPIAHDILDYWFHSDRF